MLVRLALVLGTLAAAPAVSVSAQLDEGAYDLADAHLIDTGQRSCLSGFVWLTPVIPKPRVLVGELFESVEAL